VIKLVKILFLTKKQNTIVHIFFEKNSLYTTLWKQIIIKINIMRCLVFGENVSPNEENVSPNEENVSPNEENVSPNGENVSPNGENVSPNGENVSPNEEKRYSFIIYIFCC